jgi:hypothetical protein
MITTPEAEEGEEEWKQELDYYVRFMPSSGVHAQSGKVSIVDSASEYSYTFKLFGKLPLQLAVGAGYKGIDNTTAVKLPARLTGVSFGFETTLPLFFDKTYLRFGAAPSFYTDNWSFSSKALRIPMQAFAIWLPNDKLTLVGGVAVFPRFDGPVAPILGLIYRPNDKLTLSLVPDRPNITYDLTDKLSVFLEGGIFSNEYRVTKDGMKGLILEYNEDHAGAGLKYDFNDNVRCFLSSGMAFNRFLRYRDSYGKVEVKNGVYTELRFEIGI